MSHTQTLVKTVGIEFEYFLKNSKGELVFPSDYGFPTDEFIILAECRVPPGNTLHEVMGNFYREYHKILSLAEDNKLEVYMSEGFYGVTPQFYSSILRRMGHKEVSTCSNIYKTDILEYSDSEVDENGKILRQFLSTGLHIHLGLGVRSQFIWHSNNKKVNDIDSVSSLSILTNNHRNKIIRWFDKNILPWTVRELPRLKFRQPGFYETKPWGFEYRSLPFTYLTYANMREIVKSAFTLLELK